MNKIDVHILTIESTRQDWLDICLKSLSNEPVNVHIIPGIEGNIGAARSIGFSQGTSPYITLVDPDDWVLPGGYDACLRILENNSDVEAVGTYEYEADEFGKLESKITYVPHHIMMYRRSSIEDLLPDLINKSSLPEQWLLTQVKEIVMVPCPYYVWRQHSNAWHKINRDVASKAYAEYINYRAPLKLSR